ncbi:MAG: hypothetical protein QXP55_03175 [Nitrososphaerales archaeon]
MTTGFKKKCIQCGATFSKITDYEKHLENCNADKKRKKAEFVSERLKEAYEEFK